MSIFVGHTRFSVYQPLSSSWQITSNGQRTEDSYLAELFSDERLSFRTKIFAEVSVPELAKAASRHSIYHVVSYSELLPKKWQVKLEKLFESYDFLVPDKQKQNVAPLDIHEFASRKLGKCGVYGLYRLDDDDILSAAFFDRARQYLTPGFEGMQLSLAKGFTAYLETGCLRNFREVHWPMLAIGFMNICKINSDGSLVKPAPTPHHVADRVNPVITDPTCPSFLWIRHEGQDTGSGLVDSARRSSVLNSMGKYPAVENIDEVKRIFSSALTTFDLGSSVTLFNGGHDLRTPLTINLDKPVTDFELVVTGEFGDTVRLNNALVSFGFSGTSSLPEGVLPKSGDSGIGYYRYLDTVPGRRTSRIEVHLPPSHPCTSVDVRAFYGEGTRQLIQKVELNNLS